MLRVRPEPVSVVRQRYNSAATLDVVTQKANELGVPVGGRTQALLDAHAVSIGDGAIALHNAAGVPLRSLGTGRPVFWWQECSVLPRNGPPWRWSMKWNTDSNRIGLPGY